MRVSQVCLAVFVFTASLPALAQTSCAERERSVESSAKSPADAIRELYQNECLGGAGDKSSLADQVAKRLASGDGKARRVEAVGLIEKSLLNEIGKTDEDLKVPDLGAEMKTAATKGKEVLERVQRRVKAVMAQTASGDESRESGEQNWRFVPRAFQLPPAGQDTAPVRLKADLLDTVCKAEVVMNKIDESCRDAYSTAVIVLRHAGLVRQVLAIDTRAGIDVATKDAEFRKKQWDHYFEQPRSQYPWELAVNSARYRSEIKGKEGFQVPPSNQLILLHPTLALEYISNAQKGSRFAPALLVELVGVNRWDWSTDGNTENAMGISLVASYSDRAGLSSMRYGLMLHWKNDMSFGFTRREGVTGIFLSADAAKLFGSVSDNARKIFGDPTR